MKFLLNSLIFTLIPLLSLSSNEEDFFNSKTPNLEKEELEFKPNKRDSGSSPITTPVRGNPYHQPEMPGTPKLYSKDSRDLNSKDWQEGVKERYNKVKTHYKDFK
jgi:hypothetical protein